MSDTRYPTRMHEVLGVELGERFQIKGQTPRYDQNFFVDENGDVRREGWSSPFDRAAVYLINHPERIIRRPRLTDEQVAQLKALVTLGFKWLAKQRKGYVMFFHKKPHKNGIWFSGTGDEQEDFGVELPNDTHLSSLVSWSDPSPLDIVATLKAAGVEVE